jgi:hypothetical protein
MDGNGEIAFLLRERERCRICYNFIPVAATTDIQLPDPMPMYQKIEQEKELII